MREMFRSFAVQEAMQVNGNSKKFLLLLFVAVLFLAAGTGCAQAPAGVPVFEFDKAQSSIKFHVDASVAIDGTFKRWDASLTFTSADAKTGVLDMKIDAASVDTGSGMKNNKLKGGDFFDVEKNPYITFKSTKIVE